MKDLDEATSPEDLMLGFVSSEKGKVRRPQNACSTTCMSSASGTSIVFTAAITSPKPGGLNEDT